MATTTLKKITTRAKALRKKRPGMQWKNAVKQAAKEIKGISGVKRKKKPPAAKKRRVTVVNISGTKSHHKRKKTSSMAKRKKTRRYSRRRGIGSISVKGYQDILMQTGGAIAGGIVASAIGNMIATKVNNPKAVAAIQLIGGVFIARSMAKKPLISGLGLGLAAYGGGALLRSSGILKGIGDDMEYISGEGDEMSGDDDAGGLSGGDEFADGLGDDDMGDDDGF